LFFGNCFFFLSFCVLLFLSFCCVFLLYSLWQIM
jgi:hypothetical protein